MSDFDKQGGAGGGSSSDNDTEEYQRFELLKLDVERRTPNAVAEMHIRCYIVDMVRQLSLLAAQNHNGGLAERLIAALEEPGSRYSNH